MITNKDLATAFKPLAQSYLQGEPSIELITLATSDGFAVANNSRGAIPFEEDKLAAATSTLYSVSSAVSRQILGKQFSTAFIETQSGNIAFVALTLFKRDFVMAISANEAMNIASLRLKLKQLANALVNATA